MTTMTVSPETRDAVQVLKENFDYDSADDFLSDAMEFIEENADDFEEMFPDEGEDEKEDGE